MNWNTVERGIVCALGSGIGACIVYALEWPPWSFLPTCAIMVGMVYRPSELAIAGRKSLRGFRSWLMAMPNLLMLMMSIVAIMAIPTTFILYTNPQPPEIPSTVHMCGCGIWGLTAGILWLKAVDIILMIINVRREEGTSSAFPLCRHVPWVMQPMPPITLPEKCTWGIPLMIAFKQVYALYLVPLLLLDVILTFFVMIASTQRLSMMAGGACAGIVATVCKLYGLGGEFEILASIAVGGVAGHCWYPLGKLLGQPAVRSSSLVTP